MKSVTLCPWPESLRASQKPMGAAQRDEAAAVSAQDREQRLAGCRTPFRACNNPPWPPLLVLMIRTLRGATYASTTTAAARAAALDTWRPFGRPQGTKDVRRNTRSRSACADLATRSRKRLDGGFPLSHTVERAAGMLVDTKVDCLQDRDWLRAWLRADGIAARIGPFFEPAEARAIGATAPTV